MKEKDKKEMLGEFKVVCHLQLKVQSYDMTE